MIGRGQVLDRLDGQPVRLMFGTQSAWRTLTPGVADGTDVWQLKQNLIALGFTAHGALRLDDHFDWATAVAIEQWQRALGTPQTGVVPLGSIAFLPGAARVAAHRALPGAPVRPGAPLLDLSSTTLLVSVPLDASLRQLVRVGDPVQIQLPQGQTTAGAVREIGADTAVWSGQATPSAGSQASVPVMISLEHPDAVRGLGQVPVQVGITDTVRHRVLAVPIAALLALAQGSYAVAVEEHGTRTLIVVRPGIFDGGQVEVTSSRLRPGMRVEVPSS